MIRTSFLLGMWCFCASASVHAATPEQQATQDKVPITPMPASGTTIAQYCAQTQSCDAAKAPNWVKIYPGAKIADAVTLVPGMAEPTGMLVLEVDGVPLDRIVRWIKAEYAPIITITHELNVKAQYEPEAPQRDVYHLSGMLKLSEKPVLVAITAGDQQGQSVMRIGINWSAK